MYDEPKPKRRTRLWMIALAIVASTTLTGCFDLLQEIWIAPDGSARMKLDVSLPKGLLQLAGQDPFTQMQEQAKKTEEELKKDPSVKSFSFRAWEEGDLRHLVYELEVTDATKLAELQERATRNAGKEGQQANAMRFQFERQPGGRLLFTQQLGKPGAAPTTDAGTAQPNAMGEAADAFDRAMAQAMLGGHNVTVRIHGPHIGETNGTVNEKKDTVEWKIPLSELTSGTSARELRAEIKVGAPIWVWGLFIGIPALLLLLAVSAMKRRRRAAVVG